MSSFAPQPDTLVVVMRDGRRHWRFIDLVETVEARQPETVPAALERIEQAVTDRGLYAAGYIAYEAAAVYGLSVHSLPEGEMPCLWFGLFRDREPVDILPTDSSYTFGEWTLPLANLTTSKLSTPSGTPLPPASPIRPT
ncbi:MAG: hypothetical protein R3C44_03475 [Chloroflexota bacterium]